MSAYRDDFEERAAILEFMAGMDRAEAERLAKIECDERYGRQPNETVE